jgi:hypothetical protein
MVKLHHNLNMMAESLNAETEADEMLNDYLDELDTEAEEKFDDEEMESYNQLTGEFVEAHQKMGGKSILTGIVAGAVVLGAGYLLHNYLGANPNPSYASMGSMAPLQSVLPMAKVFIATAIAAPALSAVSFARDAIKVRGLENKIDNLFENNAENKNNVNNAPKNNVKPSVGNAPKAKDDPSKSKKNDALKSLSSIHSGDAEPDNLIGKKDGAKRKRPNRNKQEKFE